MVAPNIAQNNTATNVQGFYTLRNHEQGKEDTRDTLSHDNTKIQQIHYVCCIQKQQKDRI